MNALQKNATLALQLKLAATLDKNVKDIYAWYLCQSRAVQNKGYRIEFPNNMKQIFADIMRRDRGAYELMYYEFIHDST